MSLLMQWAASPSRIRGAYRLLLHADGQRLSRSDMEKLLSPKSLQAGAVQEKETDDEKPGDMLKGVLDELIALGVAEEAEGYLVLSSGLAAEMRDPQRGDALFPMALRPLIFSKENKTNHDFAMLLAWYLSQDAQDPPSDWDEVEHAILEQFNGVRFQSVNDVRYGQFEDWSSFCGFAWTYGFDVGKNRRLMPDPTAHVSFLLPRLFAGQLEISILEFMKRLAEHSPVFEGGRFRTRLEQEHAVGKRKEQRLSTVTSLMLHRLQDEGKVRLLHKSDADVLLLVDHESEQPITHIEYSVGRR